MIFARRSANSGAPQNGVRDVNVCSPPVTGSVTIHAASNGRSIAVKPSVT